MTTTSSSTGVLSPSAAESWDDAPGALAGRGTAPPQVGTEAPREATTSVPLVDRAFAFVDLCRFTRYMADRGEHAAIDALTAFHTLTREIVAQRGVRVAKWLGDGAMLVSMEVGPAIAAAAELVARYRNQPLALRGGLAHGLALPFEGSDYIGRPVNLAARLCQAARPNELLAMGYPAHALPSWIRVEGARHLNVAGLGRLRNVQRLAIDSSERVGG